MASSVCMQCSSWCFVLTVLWLNACYGENLNDVRLVGESQPHRGRVEINYEGQWNTICNDNWGYDEATVVCRQLAYYSVDSIARSTSYPAEGSAQIQADCHGTESSLDECTLTSEHVQCSHFEDAGVECGNNIRLVENGNSLPSLRQGRVEVLDDGQWNTICDENWGLEEAQVTCRQLGFNTDDAVARGSAYFGEGSGSTFLARCKGSESTLQSCELTAIDCLHSRDTGVECGYPPTEPTISPLAIAMIVVGVLVVISAVVIGAVWYTYRNHQKHAPPDGETQPSPSTITTLHAPLPEPTSSMTATLHDNIQI